MAEQVTVDLTHSNILEVEGTKTRQLKRYELSTLCPWSTTIASCN